MNILDKLSIKHGTDKGPKHHNYTPTYFSYFDKIRHDKLKILEVGVSRGCSLMMWQEYFDSSLIYGIDKKDTTHLTKDRIKTFIGDQTDIAFLTKVNTDVGPFDIIIDDGSHINDHQIITFECLFPYLKNGGIYVIEDTSTSYWNEFKKGSKKLKSCIEFLKDRIDDLHFHGYKYKDSKVANRNVLATKPNCNIYEKNIKSIHFYTGLAFVFKQQTPE